MINLGNAVTVSAYTPLRPGLWRLEGWGPGLLLAIPTASDPNLLLCMELGEDGKVEASCTWPMHHTETLAEPMRIMRDEEQRGDDYPSLQRYNEG